MSTSGLTHVYYGYGKGKTTAALGLALRAAGCDKKVVVVQFLKDAKCGELVSLALLPGVKVFRGKSSGKLFVRDMDEAAIAEIRQTHNANLTKALELQVSGECDLLVLDEIMDACELGVVDEQMVSDLIKNKPASLELVITGHKPISWMLDAADYVTEMKKVKHPYDKGITGRRGIEF